MKCSTFMQNQNKLSQIHRNRAVQWLSGARAGELGRGWQKGTRFQLQDGQGLTI